MAPFDAAPISEIARNRPVLPLTRINVAAIFFLAFPFLPSSPRFGERNGPGMFPSDHRSSVLFFDNFALFLFFFFLFSFATLDILQTIKVRSLNARLKIQRLGI